MAHLTCSRRGGRPQWSILLVALIYALLMVLTVCEQTGGAVKESNSAPQADLSSAPALQVVGGGGEPDGDLSNHAESGTSGSPEPDGSLEQQQQHSQRPPSPKEHIPPKTVRSFAGAARLSDDELDQEDSRQPTVALDKDGKPIMTIDPGLMVLCLFLVMMGAQGSLVLWKRHYHRSYQLTTLFGLWVVPFLLSARMRFYRFLSVWVVFTALTGRLVYRSTRKPLGADTPRVVYRWFSQVYRICNFCAIMGYLCLMSVIVVDLHIGSYHLGGFGALLCFYGMYFGVLGRDCAEMCTERIASSMGYYSKSGLPKRNLGSNICAICDQELYKNVRAVGPNAQDPQENVFTLTCKHQFHEFCIRGWTMIGKKDTCPYCSEKVTLKGVLVHPWDKQSIAWAQILDGVRYLVVWNPIILITLQVILHFLPHTHPMVVMARAHGAHPMAHHPA